jgi:hypothetical protein
MTYRSLRRYMSRRQITVRGFYSLISADALQILIFQICSENPRLGIKMVANRLLAMRHRVQRVRVREAMNLIFSSRQVNRRLRRREYSVRAPGAAVNVNFFNKNVSYEISFRNAFCFKRSKRKIIFALWVYCVH